MNKDERANTAIDLRELALDRNSSERMGLRNQPRVLTRYVLPSVLIFGFLCLVAWASRDAVFPPTPVTVVPVMSTTVQLRQSGTPLFQAAGWIEPRPTPIRVAALSPGVVERLLVVEDQLVKAGDPVAELVKDDAMLVHQGALADLKLRVAELHEANAAAVAAETRFNQPVHLEATLSEAEASLAQIETILQNLPFQVRRAEADHEAMRSDYEGKASSDGVVAGITIDIAKSKADAAKATLDELGDRFAALENERLALSSRRDALKTQLALLADETQARDEAKAKIQAAKARVDQADVKVKEAKLQLDRMTVVAPVDGRVFRLIAHPGARIGSGMTQMTGYDGSTVVTMYRPNMLQVRVDVRFDDIPKVSLRQPVEINNPALPEPIRGEVLFISSEADIQKNTLQVKVAIPIPPAVFKPEMLVDVTFLSPALTKPLDKPSQEISLYVPQQLIAQDNGQPFIWLADQSSGVARRQFLTTGKTTPNGLVEVTKGLTVSSRIITNGTDGIQDGDRINVVGEDQSIGKKPEPKPRETSAP